MPDHLPTQAPAANASQLPAKVVSLRVRPFGASHLCFEADGILGDLNLTLNPKRGLLGATVPAFKFEDFYALLRSRPTQPATGRITFTINPAAGATIVLNGTTWTFVSSSPTGNQLLVESTLAATLTAALPVLRGSTDANTKLFTYAATAAVLGLTAAIGGAGGNALTFSTTVAGATASGSTLSGGDSSRLLYDFTKIQTEVAPYTLTTLRAEPKKAALGKAISMRQNAFFAKYANSEQIISFMNQYYFNPPDFDPSKTANPDSKTARLDALSDTNESMWTALNGAYFNANRQGGAAGIVDDVVSTLSSDVTSIGYAATSGGTDEVAISVTGKPEEMGISPLPAPPDPWPAPTNWPPSIAPTPEPPPTLPMVSWDGNWSPSFSGGNSDSGSLQESRTYETNSNSSLEHEDQKITTSDKVFRHPFYKAQAQYQRAQISLIDQRFSAFMSEQNIPNLATVFDNELISIDADVYRTQIAYLNTILMSPIAGVVTGVYKNPGDVVRAGEPVVRVENYAVILIEATVVFRGPILVNKSTATVSTALFGSSAGLPTSITGVVVAARGHNDDDTWHLIVECNNMDKSNPPQPIFPLSYRFDVDDTTVTIG
jgi:hypothetical protein